MNSLRSTNRQIRLLLCVVGAAVLALVYLALTNASDAPFALSMIAGFLALGVLANLKALHNRDLFAPTIAFPAAFLAWFAIGLPTLIELPSNWYSGTFEPISSRTWIYVAVGFVAYMIGCFSGSHAKANVGDAPRFRTFSVWRVSRVAIVIAGMGALMVVSYGYIALRMGLPILSLSPGEARLDVANFGIPNVIFVSAACTVAIFSMVIGWDESAPKWMRNTALATATLALILPLGFAGRGNTFIPLLTLIVARNYLKHRLTVPKLLIGALTLFAAISAYGFMRDTLTFGAADTGWQSAAGISEFMAPFCAAYLYIRSPVATFNRLTEMFPSHIPYQLGRVTLMPLQTVLPGHHIMSDVYFKEVLGSDFIGSGQPGTLLAPFYVDLGIIGIAIGMFAYGFLLKWLYRSMRNNPTSLNVLLYAWALQSGLFGLFGTLFPYITTLWIPFLWLVFTPFVTKRQAATVGGVHSPMPQVPSSEAVGVREFRLNN